MLLKQKKIWRTETTNLDNYRQKRQSKKPCRIRKKVTESNKEPENEFS